MKIIELNKNVDKKHKGLLLEYKTLIDIRHNNKIEKTKFPFKNFIDPADGFYFLYEGGILILHSSDNELRDLFLVKRETQNKFLSLLWNRFGGLVDLNNKTIEINKEYLGNKTQTRKITFIKDIQKGLKELFRYGVDKSFKLKGLVGYNNIKTVGDFLNIKDSYDEFINLKDVYMYHGTSSKKLPNILKYGLLPGKNDDIYVDLIPGYSEFNVYLTTNKKIASFYANRQAKKDESKPVILKVKIPFPSKIFADDRFIHYNLDPAASAKSGQDKKNISASRRTGEFAYRGKILPNFITVEN